jgi:hypothetical protein
MIEIEIENKLVKCPQSWDDVKLKTFEELLHFIKTTNLKEGDILYTLKVFSILLNLDINILKCLTRAGFNSLAELLSFTKIEPTSSNTEEWVIEGKKFRLFKELNQITMGDSISIETLVKDMDDSYIISAILPFVVRPVLNRTNLDGTVEEDLGDVDYKRINKVRDLLSKNLSIRDVLILKDFFLGGERV